MLSDEEAPPWVSRIMQHPQFSFVPPLCMEPGKDILMVGGMDG